ncbi:bifunctional serine/threonine-protein kinase/formylglycine-generating enzyme family protein [Coralloluteibacterium stylophorae]|uniref:SUMF1/EgtB/PvdO family nonheme iron enzyme n=2 Tax=Coralloluteibacterium stylophorae TaxID=1776034 RepID=A0AAP2C9A7_9GAMM|nr:bifunctional serine/threonine-protein kinase/formylglycine-generating enzyme family protein [Coralloluteibacterium stylophorae]MBS7456214.1 SUMF1/EgtB/PvdO family nonheme iron enzyme [Coralloluteibacterium stylophorae]
MHDAPASTITPLRAPGPPVIAGYRLLRPLGAGGMASVWLAEQESLEREVAIKIISRDALSDEVARQRFEDEARTIARLQHPAIVAIHEVGRTADGLSFYAMPYLAGGDLTRRDLGRDPARIAAILRPLLDALGYAHARGVVHRDVKAENVLFDTDGRPQLTDFGIALARRDISRISTSGRITSAGLAVGSAATMAPEQARGDAVDGRADLYSVGVLAYELLTGEAPYRADDPLALALKHAQAPIPRLPQAQRAWQRVIDCALAKAPEARYPDAAAMLADIERIAADRGGTGRRVPRTALAAAAALALLALGAFWFGTRPPSFSAPAPSLAGTTAAALPPATEQPGDADTAAEAEARFAAFEEQLANDRLTRQPGDNAAESLYAAWQQAPSDPRVTDGLERLLERLAIHVDSYTRQGADGEVKDAFARARALAVGTGNGAGDAWRRFKAHVAEALEQRLATAIGDWNRAGAETAAALMRELDLPHPELQDVVARIDALPRRGDALRDPGGPELRFVLPGAPALAVMRDEVTRGEYARFVRATGRSDGPCPNSSGFSLFDRRSWRDPGFEQDATHPVVCVSWTDAHDYAAWLSARTGHAYRLPTLAEWRQLLPQVAARAAGWEGTRAVGSASSGAHGVRDVAGNVAEWLADGSGATRLAAGRSWRDDGGIAIDWSAAQEADRGYDDVGFRLVREYGAHERGLQTAAN